MQGAHFRTSKYVLKYNAVYTVQSTDCFILQVFFATLKYILKRHYQYYSLENMRYNAKYEREVNMKISNTHQKFTENFKQS